MVNVDPPGCKQSHTVTQAGTVPSSSRVTLVKWAWSPCTQILCRSSAFKSSKNDRSHDLSTTKCKTLPDVGDEERAALKSFWPDR